MRRVSVLLSLMVVIVLGTLALHAHPVAVAQEATPPGQEFETEGITFEALAFGLADAVPTAPAEALLVRFTLDPGASFDIDANDPSLTLISVESGAFTFAMEDPIAAGHAAEEGAPFPAEPEEVAAGTEFTLEAGDFALFPPNVAGEVRNDGDEPAVALLAITAPLEEGMAEAATPTP